MGESVFSFSMQEQQRQLLVSNASERLPPRSPSAPLMSPRVKVAAKVMFKRFDEDGIGTLDKVELRKLLATFVEEQKLPLGDGSVDEFIDSHKYAMRSKDRIDAADFTAFYDALVSWTTTKKEAQEIAVLSKEKAQDEETQRYYLKEKATGIPKGLNEGMLERQPTMEAFQQLYISPTSSASAQAAQPPDEGILPSQELHSPTSSASAQAVQPPGRCEAASATKAGAALDAEEEAECTFSPRLISKQPSWAEQPGRPKAHERLYEQAEVARERKKAMILEAERAEQQQQHTPHITNYAKQLTTPNNQDRCCHLYSLASEKTANKKVSETPACSSSPAPKALSANRLAYFEALSTPRKRDNGCSDINCTFTPRLHSPRTLDSASAPSTSPVGHRMHKQAEVLKGRRDEMAKRLVAVEAEAIAATKFSTSVRHISRASKEAALDEAAATTRSQADRMHKEAQEFWKRREDAAQRQAESEAQQAAISATRFKAKQLPRAYSCSSSDIAAAGTTAASGSNAFDRNYKLAERQQKRREEAAHKQAVEEAEAMAAAQFKARAPSAPKSTGGQTDVYERLWSHATNPKKLQLGLWEPKFDSAGGQWSMNLRSTQPKPVAAVEKGSKHKKDQIFHDPHAPQQEQEQEEQETNERERNNGIESNTPVYNFIVPGEGGRGGGAAVVVQREWRRHTATRRVREMRVQMADLQRQRSFLQQQRESLGSQQDEEEQEEQQRQLHVSKAASASPRSLWDTSSPHAMLSGISGVRKMGWYARGSETAPQGEASSHATVTVTEGSQDSGAALGESPAVISSMMPTWTKAVPVDPNANEEAPPQSSAVATSDYWG